MDDLLKRKEENKKPELKSQPVFSVATWSFGFLKESSMPTNKTEKSGMTYSVGTEIFLN